jgi:adenylate kinase family enzyme
MRVTIIGNSGGGKSTLAKRLGRELGVEVYEVDKMLWKPNWVEAPEDEYNSVHAKTISRSAWIIEGLGRKDSIDSRLASSTHIVLVDFPLWQHYWLAAKRELDWIKGDKSDLPAGMSEPPPTKALFETIWNLDREWLPEIRASIDELERSGTTVFRLCSFSDVTNIKAETLLNSATS